MSIRGTLIASLLFCVLTLVPAGAHLLSLPNKIGMSAQHYLVAQKAYVGWNLAAFPVIAALLATGLLVWSARQDPKLFAWAIVAFACMLATQLVFWTLTFPGNQQTANWTQLPDNWESLRWRWEIGHAISSLLNLGALLALLAATWRQLRG
jgi:hypothetical protein